MLRALLGVSVGWLGISMVADGLPALLIPYQLLVAGRETSATTLGLLTLIAIALAAAAQPLAGHWSDRVGRLPVIASGTGIAVAGLLLTLQPATFLPGALVALIGVSTAQGGQQPLLADRLPQDWRGRGAGLKSAFDVAGALFGFVLLAALLGSADTRLAVVALVAALVVGLSLTALLLGRDAPRLCHSQAAGRVRYAYRLDLQRHGPLAALIVARFLFLLGIYTVGRFLLLFVADRFGLTPEAAGQQAGLLLALLAATTVIASLPAGWLADRIGRRPLMLAGGVFAAAGIGLMPVASSLELMLVFGGLMAIGSAAFSTGSWALLSDLTATPQAGRLLGFANLGTAAAAALAGGFGVLIDVGGYAVAFGLAALFSLVGGVMASRLTVRESSAEARIGHAEGVQ